jgi:hypothetical protein
VEIFFLAFAVTGALVFWVTFRWVLLAVILRASVAGVVAYYLWGRCERDRILVAVLAVVGLILGLVWPLALRPIISAQPMIADVTTGVTVWPQNSSAADLPDGKAAFELAGGAKVFVSGSPPVVDVTLGDSTVRVRPLPTFSAISVDGVWVTPLNRLAVGFSQCDKAVAWNEGQRRYVHLRYTNVVRVASRLAWAEAYSFFGDGALNGDLYLRIDLEKSEIDMVALSALRPNLYVHDSSLFTVALEPYRGQKIFLPVAAQRLTWNPSSSNDPRRFLNLQNGRAVLYEAARDRAGPFKELAQADAFPGYLVAENLAASKSLLVYFPDWSRQASTDISPAAGAPWRANELALDHELLKYTVDDRISSIMQLNISAELASTTTGQGRPVVGVSHGVYVNRISLRVVPQQADYQKVIDSISLWQPPRR